MPSPVGWAIPISRWPTRRRRSARSASSWSSARGSLYRSANGPTTRRRLPPPWRAVDMTAKKKLKVATTSLAGCFGCHMSFLDIDERLFTLLEHIECDRSPRTDIKTVTPGTDIGLIEGGLC